jgi:hypothetical protein
MNAKEIVDKFKKILLSDVEELDVQQEEVKLEEVAEDLAEAPMVEDEMAPEDVIEDVVEEEDKYATKEDLAKEIAALKAMIEQISSAMSAEESIDAPAELEELSKEELSSQEEVAPLTHSPESEVEAKQFNLYSQRREMTTFDRVLSKIANK